MASKEILHSVQRNVKVLKSSLAENWRIRRHLALAYRILDRLKGTEFLGCLGLYGQVFHTICTRLVKIGMVDHMTPTHNSRKRPSIEKNH